MLNMLDALTGALCRDFACSLDSLIGALEEAATAAGGPVPREGALAVATATAYALRDRLCLVRAAWSGPGDALDVATLQAMAASRFRPRLEISGLAREAVLPAPIARVVLNVLMLAEAALPAGGTIHLAGDPRSELVALLDGPHAAWPPGLAACLADPATAASELSAGCPPQAPLTVLVAQATGVRLDLLFGPSGPPPLLIRPGAVAETAPPSRATGHA